MRYITLIFLGASLLLASCERKGESAGTRTADVSAPTTLDARTSSIHLAALAAVVAGAKPHRPFTFASSLDFKKKILEGFPAEIERKLLIAAGDAEHYVHPSDVVVPEEGQMETMKDGAQRYVGLTSRASGERLDAYMVESIEETSPTTVKVNWMKYCGPLAAQGGSVELTFEDGRWTVREVEGGWVS